MSAINPRIRQRLIANMRRSAQLAVDAMNDEETERHHADFVRFEDMLGESDDLASFEGLLNELLAEVGVAS